MNYKGKGLGQKKSSRKTLKPCACMAPLWPCHRETLGRWEGTQKHWVKFKPYLDSETYPNLTASARVLWCLANSMGGKRAFFKKITVLKEEPFLHLPYALLLFLMDEARFRVEACTTEAAGGSVTEVSICKLTWFAYCLPVLSLGSAERSLELSFFSAPVPSDIYAPVPSLLQSKQFHIKFQQLLWSHCLHSGDVYFGACMSSSDHRSLSIWSSLGIPS